MGYWGASTLENDKAQDFMGGIVSDLVAKINGIGALGLPTTCRQLLQRFPIPLGCRAQSGGRESSRTSVIAPIMFPIIEPKSRKQTIKIYLAFDGEIPTEVARNREQGDPARERSE